MINDDLGALTFETHVSREVAYHRGTEPVNVQATIGRTVFELLDGYAVFIGVQKKLAGLATADVDPPRSQPSTIAGKCPVCAGWQSSPGIRVAVGRE